MICHYYLTYRCDCRCEFCRIWHDADFEPGEEAGEHAVLKNLSSLWEAGVKEVNFTGGEPLLRRDIRSILLEARQTGLFIRLLTSGKEFPKKANELGGLIDELYISLDAPFEAEHDRIRGSEAFQSAILSIDSAKKNGIRPFLNFTVTRQSIRYLPEMAETADKHDVTLRINPVHHFFGLEGFEKLSVDYIKRYAGRKSVDIDSSMIRLLREGGNKKANPSCRALSGTVTISPDDHLILPCINAKQAMVPIGGKLEKVLASDIVKGYRGLEGSLEQCEGCLDADYLVSGCSRYSDRPFRFFRRFFPAFFAGPCRRGRRSLP